MALAIDASTPAAVTGTATTTTTASFTPPTGALLLVLYGVNNSGTNDTSISSVTNSGTAITWTRRARKNRNAASDGGVGQEGGAEIWSGVMGTSAALTVTATGPFSGFSNEKLMQVMVLTGADTSTFNIAAAHNNAGTPSVTLTSCLAGSHGFASSSDWSQAGLGTVGTGQTMIAESNVSGQITLHTWRTTSTLAANGNQTMNLTAPATQDYNLVAIEIKAAGGGGPAFIAEKPRIISQAVQRAAVW